MRQSWCWGGRCPRRPSPLLRSRVGCRATSASAWAAGLGDTWMPESHIAWDYPWQDLAGGVNTRQGWETRAPNGTFALNYAAESDRRGYVPMFPYRGDHRLRQTGAHQQRAGLLGWLYRASRQQRACFGFCSGRSNDFAAGEAMTRHCCARLWHARAPMWPHLRIPTLASPRRGRTCATCMRRTACPGTT